MSSVSSISSFVFLNVVAGGLNYLFQVVGARELSVEDFANFNVWFAYSSMFAFAGGLLQNASNFYLLPRRHMLKHLGLIAILIAILLFFSVGPLQGVEAMTLTTFITLAVINGWLTGQSQVRMLYTTMAMAGVTLAVIKLGWAMSHISVASVEGYINIVTFSFLPSIVVLGWALSKTPMQERNDVKHTSTQVLIAALAISVATAIIPQLDILVLSKTLEKSIFDQFVQASIFYKVVFFFFLIVAQWLLPQQTNSEHISIFKKLTSFLPIVTAVIGASFLTIVSEPISIYVMDWNPAPPKIFVFLSCLNMALLTWLFLLIQECCAKKKAHVALASVLSVATLGFSQYFLALDIYTYFAVNDFVALVLILFLLRFLKQMNRTTNDLQKVG